ncbi:hypothetical protein L6452_21908 [Arctium lappa]|uniref:Uncharacterized protein n=1 Tax=Arctium lappa TaxID=4217 RepID=A0ACB9AZ02_ARCLA|nr:hypothetical protein L6452_21908 [Arctium lappa]
MDPLPRSSTSSKKATSLAKKKLVNGTSTRAACEIPFLHYLCLDVGGEPYHPTDSIQMMLGSQQATLHAAFSSKFDTLAARVTGMEERQDVDYHVTYDHIRTVRDKFQHGTL